jgi:hypothetical protein
VILDRRRFLTALGLGGAGAALAPSLVRADDSAPKRLIVLSTGHGTPYEHWKMRPGSEPDEGTWVADLAGLQQAEFSRSLAPLHEHRKRLLCLDGLSLASAELDLPGYRHEKGWIHAWTGGWAHFTGADLFSTEPSLDQLVARHVARPDRLQSLELQVHEGRPICHAGKAQQLPLEGVPARAWERIFGLAQSTDPLVGAQGSVLDYASREYDAVRRTLGASDRSKLDIHFELVRQLEQRIAGLSEASCAAPELLGVDLEDYNATFDAHTEIIAAAFACDMVRVVALSLGDLPSEAFGWGHYLSGDAHNDFAHRIFEDPQAAEAMSDYTGQHATQLARLISMLEAIPEGSGSVMDNTLIVWGSEIADGWHGLEKYCVTVAGGSWAFELGRYAHWPWNNTPIPMVAPSGMTPGSGLPHQHLLVSVAQAMGLDLDHVGLVNAMTLQGERVDFIGGLPL